MCQANIELQRRKLVIYSWGNVSAIDREAGIVVIKPSGVEYDDLTLDKMVVLTLDGRVKQGNLRPSSDTPTHLELYRHFKDIGGVCHTHSRYATMWAQACRPVPCFGTTHADYFYGPVPVTEKMTPESINKDYEVNTGRIIVERFRDLNPLQMPAVLVAGHGPFTWGRDPAQAVEASVILEEISAMAMGTVLINPEQKDIPKVLLDKHYLRKHGENAYYGQQ